MKTEALIHELSACVAPVRRIERPGSGLFRWAALSTVCVVAGILTFGLRPDVGTAVRSPQFLLLAALVAALGVVSTLSALLASVPGMDRPWTRMVPHGILALCVGVLVCAALSGDGIGAGMGITCVERIVALALLPSVLMFRVMRNAVPIAAGWVGLLAALGATAPGAFAIQFICRHDDPYHVLVWHYLPLVLAAIAGVVLGSRWRSSWMTR